MTDHDRWKTDGPEEYTPKEGDPSCDECEQYFPDEDSNLFLKNGLCENCGEYECESCGERLLEKHAIPFNDCTTDGTPYFCPDCAEEEGYEPI